MTREIQRRAISGITNAITELHVLPPGKQTLVQAMHMLGVQRRAGEAGKRDAAAIHDAAARGIATPSSPLPYMDRIQRLFGRHDISAVQAHTGTEATASARAMGAEAYATENHVVLGDKSDLHTVAHEATHVVQQRGGVQLKQGVGEAGDAHERHADEVADAVTRGESVEQLLGTPANSATSTMSGHAVQRMEQPEEEAEPQPSLSDRFQAAVGTGLPGSHVDEQLNGQTVKAYQISQNELLFHGTKKAFTELRPGQIFLSVFETAQRYGTTILIVEMTANLRLLDLSDEATVKAILLTEDPEAEADLHDALFDTTSLYREDDEVKGTFRKGTVGKQDNFLCQWTEKKGYDGFVRLPVEGKGFPEISVHAMQKLRVLGHRNNKGKIISV